MRASPPSLSRTKIVGGTTPFRTVLVLLCRGERPCPSKQREALSFRASANTGVGIRLSLPPSAREVAARSAGGGRDSTRFSPPVGCADSPLPKGVSQRGTAALTGRRTPRAFVPLRSTAGRRPLRLMCGCTRLSFRRGRCPHRPAGINAQHSAAGHMGPALQGARVRADRVDEPARSQISEGGLV